ncbi:GNAT family N-acetyltransferase [Thiomicrospira sp. WB1]|uniref:GNAT family N-acetyltransferase n=1 Tax=Thiomicrospira sp. WB1 TaxID=1685380 RepID=UPI000A89C246|nr:N-acetyltransferase [Thiomicrospira sp. WB1]
MNHHLGHSDQAPAIIDLFRRTFTQSEGAEEGHLIATLAHQLIEQTDEADRLVWVAENREGIQGCVIFSRLHGTGTDQAFLMAPVAVCPTQQRKGIGQAMIQAGLSALLARNTDWVLTYGDPAYYARTGFRPILETQLPPPYPLSFPQGWLGQSLTQTPLPTLNEPLRCVPALQNPAYW